MTTIATSHQESSIPRNRVLTTFGLSKNLSQPIDIKINYMECTDANLELATISEKFTNPTVFRKLSNIYRYSDLFVTIEVYDGKDNNLISIPIQTSYKAFNNKKRIWNQVLKLAIDGNQVWYDSYVKFTVMEIVNTEPFVFGVGFLSLFNHKSSTLRSGSHKIPIFTERDVTSEQEKLNYGTLTGQTALEQDLINYENGQYPRINWLDKIALPKIDVTSDCNRDHDYYLYIELPQYEFPIIYSDITYNVPSLEPRTSVNPPMNNTTSKVINSIDIPMSTSSDPKATKIYDPDFQLTANCAVNSTTVANVNSTNANAMLDPIELKFHKLERNINNNSIIDKDLKPSPQLRDELLKILLKPSNAELTDNEKNLMWRFRYYFSKNNSNDSNTKATKSFLPKFLKSINWENDYELDHTFKEILPLYWSVENLQIGDALELLGKFFNPHVLGKSRYSDDKFASKSDDAKLTEDELRFQKVFENICYLRKLAVERLKLASSEELLLYLLQLVQALKYEALIYQDVAKKEQVKNEEAKADLDCMDLPLAKFLIESAVENEQLGNFFYWYVKVENEDQLSKTGGNDTSIYAIILNKYIECLKIFSHEHKVPYYKHLKRQIWFIKKLTHLVELLRTTFKKGEATTKKIEFLRDYLSSSINELLKFPEPFPLPLDPSIMVCGCYPQESSVFKSSLAPLKITLKTIEPKQRSRQTSQIFGKKSTNKYGKYPLMFKIGDDLRQDQLVIQIINLMDQLLKNENLDLKLTPYKILATSPVAGLIQFVPNETLDVVLSKYAQVAPQLAGGATASAPVGSEGHKAAAPSHVASNGILNYLRLHSQDQDQQSIEPASKSVLHSSSNTDSPPELPPQPKATITSDLGVSPQLMDNYVKSCAGYCVITYILGVGDRHLDNLLLSPNGKFWHADFGYILGRDPKPFPPLMKLPIQVIDGMGGMDHENFHIFKNYCFITYTTLRKNSNLILNLFQLMLDANIPDITIDPSRVVEKVQDKFCLQMTEEEAILHFQDLINDSVNAFLPVVIDRLHSLAQYWRA
ncbi:Vps34 autophosphorylated class III phosphatidylinositol 3-kinase [Candida orthopsilosis Co 90-125]|uniref:Phosphatidylinositol 3-kinase VPS34 n=1 Tax=Candida orthopsilosis (strain 90-125) TaxID=1136231 RepID=H8WY63_CANO9|nr:Vps34 autophosphorylated class III phosphatidylinositol 3-kinase [Candida orthopsilosis Co 90-125]CCG21010.1 Vps34 autophosphorylated class III phosphatidylinositol 3-kinase [Candida orthopsilosis Co 90-125]